MPPVAGPAIVLDGAINLAATLSIPGAIAHRYRNPDQACELFRVEHPSGVIELTVTVNDGVPVRATIISTARKLFDGNVFAELAR